MAAPLPILEQHHQERVQAQQAEVVEAHRQLGARRALEVTLRNLDRLPPALYSMVGLVLIMAAVVAEVTMAAAAARRFLVMWQVEAAAHLTQRTLVSQL